MHRRTLLSAALGSSAALSSPRLAQAQGKRVLRFVPQSDLAILDPVWTSAYVTRNHGLMVFDTLYGMDAQYRIQPQMVEGHVVEPDGLTWTLTLREGLRWHDGEKVLARDCTASIRRWAARDGLGQSLLAAIDELSAPDDRTLRFRLKKPFPLLTYALGKPGSPVCVMMPERLAQTDPNTQIREMVGSGPFRFVAEERLAGARVVYARNPDYVPRAGTPSFTAGPKEVFFERVEWHVLPDPSTAAAALRAGEVDWWEAPPFDLLPALARDRAIRTAVPDPTGYIGTMRLNHLHPPFNNPALRRALLPALRQADFMQAVAGEVADGWRDGVGFFCPDTPMASTAGLEALTAPRDLERARRDVAASGYRGEKAVLLAPSDFPTLKALGDVAADLLQRLGIQVDYQSLDWGSTLSRLTKMEPVEQGGWSVFSTYWAGMDQLDPAVHSSLRANGRAGPRGWPSSEKLEALRAAWMEQSDQGERIRIAAEMQRQAFEDVPYLPLGQLLTRTAWKGLTAPPHGFALFWQIRPA
ncbi:ABC transporter substrate-binding protein [Roseomonas sp. GC11]|uniref:ABC transporter substrate-binding protein n=1 Tax=Roseomonas sp. GC11 TaxID=2950546 RepID=UPI00351E179A